MFPPNELIENFINPSYNNELNTEEQNNLQNYMCNTFIKIITSINKFLSEFYKKQLIVMLVSSIFFGIFVLVIFSTIKKYIISI